MVGARAERGDEIVLGDVVNTAYRIEEATPAGCVFVGEATYRPTRDVIDYGERRLIEAKGKPEAVPAWEALRARSTLPAVSERPLQTPLVGRQEELTLVLNTLARAKRHQTVQLVTLIGAPGIGKSRLLWELQLTLERASEPIRWHRGRSLPYGEGVAYWALEEIVKNAAGILETDDAAAAHEKLHAAVQRVIDDAREAAWTEAHLRPLLGLGIPEPGETRDEAFSAWRQCVEAMAKRTPRVLVFEDLQWADEGLLDFIEHMADWSRDAPVLLLCTARPDLLDRRDDWGSHGNALTITLPPLSSDETGELLSLLLDRAGVPAGLRETLLARAEGNPLYAEEFVRMLVERRLLVQEDGGWTLRPDDLPVPESVQGIIASRLDALDADEKAIVQAASVIGRTFFPDALAAVAARTRDDVDRLLGGLHRRGIFRAYRAPAGVEREHVFHHALVRDVAYGQIPRARRAAKHLRAADWLESFGRPEDHAETAAHHYLAALEYARALGDNVDAFADRARAALRRAGDRALALNAFDASARFFAGALELSPESRERADLLFSYGKALSASAAPDEGVLLEARDAMVAADDADRAAETDVMLAELMWQRGRRDEAFAHLADAVARVEGRPPSYAKARAFSMLAQFKIRGDEAPAALEAARTTMTIADELGLDDLRADALMTIGLTRVTTGDLGGLEDLERSIAIAEAANSPLSLRGYLNLGSMVANLGDLRRAASLYAQGHRLAERFGGAAWSVWLEVERLFEHYWKGEWDAACALADQLLARAERGQGRRLEHGACLVRGWIALARGDVATALADADRALAFAREAGEPQNLYPALALRARTRAAAGSGAEAAASADELLHLMRDQPSLPSFWVVDLAIVLARLGRGAELIDASSAVASTRWLEAACAYIAGDLARAADLYAEVGALPEEAYARLMAAATAVANGRAAADDQLPRALDFYRRVGAAAYCREAEALLAASELSLAPPAAPVR